MDVKTEAKDAGVFAVDKLIAQARHLASEYRRATGRPLAGVSNEVAIYDAVRLLDLDLAEGAAGGYDAVGRGAREGKRIQIKGRVIFDERKHGQRIGQLNTGRDWDSVMLVLMDDDFSTYEIYEAQREDVIEALGGSWDSKRSKRGAMSVAKFKVIARLVWTRENGVEDDEIWVNQ